MRTRWQLLIGGVLSSLLTCVAPAVSALNYQGLWWNAPAGSESGWGINFAHQGDVIFATWFTYDAQLQPWWLIGELHKSAAGVYSGPVSTATGPPFNADPFPPEGTFGGAVENIVGTMTATFSDASHGTIAYTVNGTSQTKTIVPQQFGAMPTCTWGAQPDLARAGNYTDLWWKAPAGSESGWGINFSHQGDIIFATWFTYDARRKPWWLIAELRKMATGVYSGPVLTVSGPPFDADPFPPEGSPGGAVETIVGTATLTFADGNAATFGYVVNGMAQTKAITRQVFVPPGTVCEAPVRAPVSVTVQSPTATPWVGEKVQLTATATDAAGYPITDQPVTWTSSNPALATVSATGTLEALATGPVAVMATVGGVSSNVTLTISPVPRIAVSVGGTKEVVFAYATDRCDDSDKSDNPTRLVRAEDGSLVLFASQAPKSFVSRGTDFDSFKRDCNAPVFVAAERSSPESYENMEWLWSIYRVGSRWHALIHNEYHDPVAGNCKVPDQPAFNPCWYNAVTYAVSIDAARNFVRVATPAHVVAPPPLAWVPPAVPQTTWYVQGYFAPTNIVRGPGAFYYALARMVPDPLSPRSPNYSWKETCVIRTGSLDDPASWRAWDGSGFDLGMTSPYVTGSAATPCRVLETDLASGHMVYNTYLERYLHVSQYVKQIEGREVCGIYFALSADLIHWSEPRLLAEAKTGLCEDFPLTPGMLEPVVVGYSSIIDHADTTANFERAGRTPYLYYTRYMEEPLGMDVVRVPLTFTRTD